MTGLFPYYYGSEPLNLMPGLVIYSLGYGFAVTALYRFILFVTQIGTGTTAALISMLTMCFLAVGIEVSNGFFASYGNLGIAQYVGWIGFLYFVCASVSLFFHNREKALGSINL